VKPKGRRDKHDTPHPFIPRSHACIAVGVLAWTFNTGPAPDTPAHDPAIEVCAQLDNLA